MAGTAWCSTSKTSPGVRTTCAARLDLSTDFEGLGSFNLKLSHNRHWLTANGTEWRNRLQIGAIPAIFTELYHPLNWTVGLANDWLVAGYPTGAVLFTAQAATRSRATSAPRPGQASIWENLGAASVNFVWGWERNAWQRRRHWSRPGCPSPRRRRRPPRPDCVWLSL